MYVFVIRMYMGYTGTLYMYMYMTMCLRYACELHFHRVVLLFMYICMTICLRYVHRFICTGLYIRYTSWRT